MVVGLAIDRLSIMVNAFGFINGGSGGAKVGIGRNSTSTNSSDIWTSTYDSSGGNGGPVEATLMEIPAIDYSYYAWIEGCFTSSCIFFAADPNIATGGISGEILN